MTRSGFQRLALVCALAVVVGLRVAYVTGEPRANPLFDRPLLDAGYYLDWARALTSGEVWQGAFYLAPLYAYVLGGLLSVTGGSLLAIVVVQESAGFVTLALLAVVSRRLAGAGAAWATFFLGAFYHPFLFFSARTMAEPLGILLLAAALCFMVSRTRWPAGVFAGLGSLARPNLLLLPVVWVLREGYRGRYRGALVVALGAALCIAPVALRNRLASGHLVAVSSNGGLTLFHGNGPGSLGVFNPPDGFSGSLVTQRLEAQALASLRSGADLDAVEADRWWGREAVRARVGAPLDSLLLLGRKVFLSLDSYEHGLDEAPALDANPWRLTWRVPGKASLSRTGEIPLLPFGALAGLALSGLILRGFTGTGAGAVWGAVGVTALPLLVFYVSSRYRLPLAMILMVPAGIGLHALVVGDTAIAGRRTAARIAAVACLCLSLVLPFGDLRAAEEAGILANLASAAKQSGDFERAESFARAAVARDERSVPAQYALGVVRSAQGNIAGAEAAYRAALASDPGHAESAANLAVLLNSSGRAAEGVPILRGALAARPTDVACWTDLVIAHALTGDLASARSAAREARASGVALEPGLLHEIGETN